jgi:hypothetical protein
LPDAIPELLNVARQLEGNRNQIITEFSIQRQDGMSLSRTVEQGASLASCNRWTDSLLSSVPETDSLDEDVTVADCCETNDRLARAALFTGLTGSSDPADDYSTHLTFQR